MARFKTGELAETLKCFQNKTFCSVIELRSSISRTQFKNKKQKIHLLCVMEVTLVNMLAS